MTGEPPRQGLLDTNILILRQWILPEDLPDEMAISAIARAERAESEFDPVPFDAEAARIYGRVTAALVAAGRKPRRRSNDRMIAATAIAADLPLFTTNPDDFRGLEELLFLVPVCRPTGPHER